MRNRWSVYPDDVVCWRAELPDLPDERVEAWSRSVLAAGAETGVLKPLAPVAGLLPFEGVLPTATRLAFVNHDGDVVEDDVADMADLLVAIPTTASPRHERALNIMSIREMYGGISTTVGVATDIWLPWSAVPHEPGMRWDELVDNSELAAVHTPRLNAFLAAVRAATEEVGGALSLDAERTFPLFAFEVDDTGVLLDVPLSARA